MKFFNLEKLNTALLLLNERLEVLNSQPINLVVCGGSALIVTKLVNRTTQDIDVVALIDENGKLKDPEPFPPSFEKAAEITAATLSLPKDWINYAPVDLFRMGLPENFVNRLQEYKVGSKLTVYFISRIDQIFFKLYATVDRGGYHISDLLTLNPTEEELLSAAKWTMTHDVSEGFREMLIFALKELGYESVANKL